MLCSRLDKHSGRRKSFIPHELSLQGLLSASTFVLGRSLSSWKWLHRGGGVGVGEVSGRVPGGGAIFQGLAPPFMSLSSFAPRAPPLRGGDLRLVLRVAQGTGLVQVSAGRGASLLGRLRRHLSSFPSNQCLSSSFFLICFLGLHPQYMQIPR